MSGDESNGSDGPWGSWGLLAAVALLAVLWLVVWWGLSPVPPRPASAPATAFSAERALAVLERLMGDGAPRRDLLIEYLHGIQDRYGHLSAAHLAALAEAMRLPMAEVYEVASFYAHFDIVREGETPPPEITIRVCDSLTCEMMGSEALHAGLQDRLLAAALDMAAPGGLLVYAVCSLQPEEGPERIAALLSGGARAERVPVEPGELDGLRELITAVGDLRTLPCHLAEAGGMDGFYACRLRRRSA